MFCSKCGNQVPDGMQFCPVCGVQMMSPQSQVSQIMQNGEKIPNGQIKQPRNLSNQSSFQQGGFPQGGFSQNGYQQSGYQQGGFQSGFQQGTSPLKGNGSFPQQSGFQQGTSPLKGNGGYSQGGYSQGGYPQSGFQGAGGQNPGNKTLTIVIAICSVVILLSFGTMLFVKLFSAPTVKLDKYITIDVSGYDSVATAEATFDVDGFYDDLEKKIKYKGGGPLGSGNYNSAAECLYEEYIYGELEKDRNISNGDTVKYIWDIDQDEVEDKFKVKLKFNNVTKKVDGLKEADTFDMFADIHVSFEGSDSDASIRIQNNSSIYPVSEWTFVADRTTGLKNGDKVNVYIENPEQKVEQCLQEYGKIPDATSKEYEVSNLNSGITSLSQIPADTMASMKEKVEQDLRTFAINNWNKEISISKMTYMGAHFLTEKPGKEAQSDNVITLVYAVDTALYRDDTVKATGTYGYYYFGEFYNVTLQEDGSCYVDMSNCVTPTETTIYSTNNYDYYFQGYDSYDALFNKEVAGFTDVYDYETNVDKSIKAVTWSYEEQSSGAGHAKDIFPDSSTRYLSESEVRSHSSNDVQTGINEIYARHGYKFHEQDVLNYFMQFDWYRPVSGDQADVKRQFNAYENANVELMQKYR